MIRWKVVLDLFRLVSQLRKTCRFFFLLSVDFISYAHLTPQKQATICIAFLLRPLNHRRIRREIKKNGTKRKTNQPRTRLMSNGLYCRSNTFCCWLRWELHFMNFNVYFSTWFLNSSWSKKETYKIPYILKWIHTHTQCIRNIYREFSFCFPCHIFHKYKFQDFQEV